MERRVRPCRHHIQDFNRQSPPDGSKRAKDSNDLLVPSEIAKEMPDYIAAALFNALQVNPESRTRSIEKFRDQLTAPAVSAFARTGRAESFRKKKRRSRRSPKRKEATLNTQSS